MRRRPTAALLAAMLAIVSGVFVLFIAAKSAKQPQGGGVVQSRDAPRAAGGATAPSQASAPHHTRAAEPNARDAYALDAVRQGERDQVRRVLALIDAGGPFHYPKDGATFSNFERQLPAQRRGYYREYTVPTAGAHNRGARRVIRGNGGETYYTNDHYRTFTRIDRRE